MTDYKALCAELHAAFNTYAVDMAHHDLLERARAVLAEPEPPADGEVAELSNLKDRALKALQFVDEKLDLPLHNHCNAIHAICTALDRLATEPEPPGTGEVPKLRGAPAAWLYRGDPDFDGTTWLVNWRVTTDERVARFNAQPDKPVPLFRHPSAN